MASDRREPNIVLTGTPGVGKSSHAAELTRNTGLRHVCVGALVKQHGCQEGWDEERRSWVVDEEKLLDVLEPILETGGNIIDWHACDLYPERLIDLVVVLRADSAPLHDRLQARAYADSKLQENLDAEIMGVLMEEAREAYAPERVVELWSNGVEDLEANCERIEQWIKQWRKERQLEEEEDEEKKQKGN